GKLTEPQSEILKGLLKQINDVELSKGLEEFRKKQEAAMKEVNDAIISANTELQTQRVNNLRDEFEREREQIALNYQSAVDEINRRSEDFRKKVDEDTKKGLISPEVARRKKLIAAYLFGQLLDQAEMARLNAQVDAAFKQFQKTLETAKKGFDSQLVAESEETTRQVREQVGKFLEGQITFEQYQKNLTAILKHEAATRRRIQLEEAEE